MDNVKQLENGDTLVRQGVKSLRTKGDGPPPSNPLVVIIMFQIDTSLDPFKWLIVVPYFLRKKCVTPEYRASPHFPVNLEQIDDQHCIKN